MSKSAEDLFRDAPEGTTHWDASDCRVNSFMKLEGDTWFYWPPASLDSSWNEWGKSGDHDVRCMIKRPQPKPWSGPEDGLPPVGTVCEVYDEDEGEWVVGKVVYLGVNAGSAICVTQGEHDLMYGYGNDDIRKPRTQEQIANDKRETAIRELMDIAQVDCRVTAARLVDAGFKLPSKAMADPQDVIADLRDHIAHANFRRSPSLCDEELAKQLYGAGFKREVA